MNMFRIVLVIATFSSYLKVIDSFSSPVRVDFSARFPSVLRESSSRNNESRREFVLRIIKPILVTSIVGITGPITPVIASDDDSDLTKKLFNADGSLKQQTEIEAKFRSVELLWDVSDRPFSAVDGRDVESDAKGSSLKISYKLPEIWGDGNELYVDKRDGVNRKACKKITVYQAPGTATVDRLEKASKVGVYKALDLKDDFIDLKKADLISGRTSVKGGQKYFEFDLAVAPSTCDSSSDNLGLGFCPYESIYLVSSTIVNDRLYAFIEECDKSQWKRSNAELKQVRSSFVVSDFSTA